LPPQSAPAFVNMAGVCGCAGACAGEFGEHPDTARDRMRWALATVTQATATATRAA
jgi:hypothetical protein